MTREEQDWIKKLQRLLAQKPTDLSLVALADGCNTHLYAVSNDMLDALGDKDCQDALTTGLVRVGQIRDCGAL